MARLYFTLFMGLVAVSLSFVLPVGAKIFGFDFGSADKAFVEREAGREKIADARAKYMVALRTTEGRELIKAVTRLAMLDYYEALMVPQDDRNGMIAIFDRCLSYVDKIANTDSVEYHYWKAGCIAGWAFADGSINALPKTKEIWSHLVRCWQLDPNYEGGGCYRMAGALLSDPRLPPYNPFGPARDCGKAKDYLEMALKSDASSNIDPAFSRATETGDYYFASHYFYAQSLECLGNDADARSVLDDVIGRGRDGDLPKGREPETRLEIERMKELRGRL